MRSLPHLSHIFSSLSTLSPQFGQYVYFEESETTDALGVEGVVDKLLKNSAFFASSSATFPGAVIIFLIPNKIKPIPKHIKIMGPISI